MTQKNRAGTKAGGLSTQALPPTQLRHYGLAMLLVGVALGASLLLQHFHFRVPAAPLLLFAVAISSWYGGPRPAALAAIVSTISFYWYFVEPVRTPYIYVSEIPYFITFAAFAALISWFATIRRRTDQALREKADLLDLTHDTVFVMDMEGAIKYWNRGAEGLYGWTTEQAVSKVVYALLNTVFPVPREEIVAEVVRTGRWEGELVQTKKDGTPVAVASRWALQRDERGAPVAVMETNNDITQRQRAEEALRRLNRELRAISNCNQALLRATDDQSLLEEICRIVCDEAGYCVAWVGYAEQDEAKSMRPVAWTGIEEEEVANLGVTWADTERGRGPGGTAIRTGKTCFVKDYTTDPDVALWRENALQHGFRSAIGLPLKDENANPFGSLIIYSAQPNAFTPEEIRLLEELAADLAFGIVTLRSRAARDRAEQGLRRSEAYRMEAERLTHTGSWAVDVPSDKYVYCSEEDLRIWGYDPQGPLPTRETVFRQVLPEDGKRVEESFQKALREKVDTSCEYRIVLPDGTLKHVHVLRHPILNSAGEVVKLVGTSMDITERKQAEEALRRSEAYLAEGQRLSHTGSFAADCDLKPLYWTEEMYRILGLDPQQGLPALDQLLQRVHPGDMGRHLQAWDRAIKQKLDSEVEFRIVLPDGTIKHVQGIGHPVLNDKAEVVEVVGTLIDITERKRAEEALRRSEAYLAEAQRLSRTGSWALDVASGRYEYCSDECLRIYGFDPQEGFPTREAVFRRIHPGDWKRVEGRFEKSLHEKVDSSDEHRIVLPDGTVKHVHVIRHPVMNGAGDLVKLVGTSVDITERKRTEEALRESETRFRTFVDHAADALFIYDFEQGTIVDVNRQACESLGYTRQELIGTTAVVFHLDSDRAQIKSVAERTAAGETVIDRHWHRRKDGTLFPVEIHTSQYWYGGCRFLLKVARDISDRKRAEQEGERLRQLEADLAHINRVSMLGELAASIAHEVNQPLSGVVSNGSACLRWLAADVPNLEEARETARRIVRDGKRAAEVIARIRAMTKGAVTPREKLDLNDTIREVLALVGDEAKKKSVIIRTQFADDLSPVSGDRVQLQQVMLNLVMNAIEAMGNIDERTRDLLITTRNVDPEQIQVTVKDTGPGIDPNKIDKIFDPFYTTKPGGMGMGLSISRSILQAHGGRLWAPAKDGPGTIFSFTLPIYQQESNAGASAV